MNKKVIYVTGCLGFMGSHLTRKLLQDGHYVVGVDKQTYAANVEYLEEFTKYKSFKYIKQDIKDLESLIDCDYVINTAAETHVDNSIIGTNKFIISNILGVENLLNLLLTKKHFCTPIFLQFSTDEVYGDIIDGKHLETDILKPSNPYSASKAAADMLILAWARTYNLPYLIVRPTNNYGVGQYSEKFIPKSCKHLLLNKKIPLHEKGKPIRTWLHVSDMVNGIITLIKNERKNEIYNISGNFEIENIEVAKKIVKNFTNSDNFDDYFDFSFTRFGQDVRYAIDDSKLRGLGWEPISDFDQEIKSIVKTYKQRNTIW